MGTYYIKEDDRSPSLQATLKNPDGRSVKLGDANVNIRVAKARGGENIVNSDADKVNASEGIVGYTFSDGETSEDGRYRVEFEVDYVGGATETFPNKGYHTLMVGRNMEQ